MTVCVAAMNSRGVIACASDQMLSLPDGQTSDGAAFKTQYLDSDWRALFSADDIRNIPPLIRCIRDLMELERKDRGITPDRPIKVEQMTALLRKAFQAERLRSATESYLSPHGVSHKEFIAKSRAIFGNDEAAVIRHQIQAHELGCQLIVIGHDGPVDGSRGCKAHVLSVEDPGKALENAITGYCAIGTGECLAVSSLMKRRHGKAVGLPDLVYNVCEAKFSAESDSAVGWKTYATVHKPNRRAAYLGDDVLDAIRRECVAKVRPSLKLLALIDKWERTVDWHRSVRELDQLSKPTISSKDQT